MACVAYTPQPAIFDLRRSIIRRYQDTRSGSPLHAATHHGSDPEPARVRASSVPPVQWIATAATLHRRAGGDMDGIVQSWGRILAGYTPSLSIEITRECPLRCPGCYAYGSEHLGGGITLREVSDFKGQALIDGVIELVGSTAPCTSRSSAASRSSAFASSTCCCRASRQMGLHMQVVTSAVRPIPTRVGELSRACRSSCPSMACSRSTTSAGRPRPTIASSSTSSAIRSSCTAR